MKLLALLISVSLLASPMFVRAAGDEDATVNEEKPPQAESTTKAPTTEEPERVTGFPTSPFAKTRLLFVQPKTSDLPAGRPAKILIGFQNSGNSAFVVQQLDGSFRYPQDFSYSIQNFTSAQFNKQIEAGQEATFEYNFIPSETFSSRQFGFTLLMRYKNTDGKMFMNSVFNSTINVVEPDEGLDGETFLLYIFLAALVVLIGIGAQQFAATKFGVGKGSASSAKSAAKSLLAGGSSSSSNNNNSQQESSTMSGDIDLAWIPKGHVSAKTSPKTSPRQRKANAN